MRAELPKITPAPLEEYGIAWTRVTTEAPPIRLSNDHFAPFQLQTKMLIPVQLFAIPDGIGITELADALRDASIIRSNTTDTDTFKMIKFFPLRSTAKPGSTNNVTVTLPFSTTLMSYLRLEKFLNVGGAQIGIRLSYPLTSSTEVKLVEHKAALRKESPGRQHLCIALNSMGCSELTAYLWIMNSLHEQQIQIVAMRWDPCQWSGDGATRKADFNIPFYHKLAGLSGSFPSDEARRAAIREQNRDHPDVRVQITEIRNGRSSMGFNLILHEPMPFIPRDGPTGIQTQDHFRLPTGVTPDRVLLWYNYPHDARERLLRINPEAQTAWAQELCIQAYLGGEESTQEVRLRTVGRSGTIDMGTFPMTIHPTAEIAAEIHRRGCIDPGTASPNELIERLDFLAEGSTYTRMKCCPIADLDSLPPPVVGKMAGKQPPSASTENQFDFRNPNPTYPNSSPSSGSLTPGSAISLASTESAIDLRINSSFSKAEAQLNQQLTLFDSRINSKINQFRELIRNEIREHNEKTEDLARQIQIGQQQLTKQVRDAELKANEAAEKGRLDMELLQRILHDNMSQQAELRGLVIQTQRSLQQMQLQVPSLPGEPSSQQPTHMSMEQARPSTGPPPGQ
jgi:hypothetical protein